MKTASYSQRFIFFHFPPTIYDLFVIVSDSNSPTEIDLAYEEMDTILVMDQIYTVISDVI